MRPMLWILGLLAVTLLLVYFWPRSEDPWRERFEQLAVEAQSLEEVALAARHATRAAEIRLAAAVEDRAAQRAVYEARQAEWERVSASLRARVEELGREVEAEPAGFPELEDLELATRTRDALVLFTPPASPPPEIEVEEDRFVSNRSAIESALESTRQTGRLLDLVMLRGQQVEGLEERIEDARVEILSGDTLYRACSEALGGCEDSMRAQLALAENAEARLEARARQVASLEGKIRTGRLKWLSVGIVAGWLVAGTR
jgi:hypothetical protein